MWRRSNRLNRLSRNPAGTGHILVDFVTNTPRFIPARMAPTLLGLLFAPIDHVSRTSPGFLERLAGRKNEELSDGMARYLPRGFSDTALTQAPSRRPDLAGTHRGTVLDSSGAVLPGATITMTSEQTNQVQTTTSSETGAFLFPQVPVGTYKIEIELQGFKTATFTKVSRCGGAGVLADRAARAWQCERERDRRSGRLARPDDLPGSDDDRRAPAADRSTAPERAEPRRHEPDAAPGRRREPHNRTNTAINGGRPTWTQVTQDGINIQDNFIRTNSLDFVPNRPTSDNVGEFSIVTSAQGVDNAGWRLTGPDDHTGGHQPVYGNAYEFNRDTRIRREHVLQQALEPPGQLSEPAEPVRRQRWRAPAKNQAVLLRQLRGLPAGAAGRAELDDPGPQRSPDRHLPLLRGRDGSVRSGERAPVGRPDDRSGGSERDPVALSRSPETSTATTAAIRAPTGFSTPRVTASFNRTSTIATSG